MTGRKISIAMATYNGARFIAEQLDSLAAQSLLPDELAIGDDGSTDGTLEIVESFARTAPFRVRVHRNTVRLGHSRNFEATIRRCEGNLIFYCDQDDVWFEDKLEVVAAAFASDTRIRAVINDQVITDCDLNHGNVTMLQNIRTFGQGADDFQSGCCTAIRKDWADLVLPIPEEIDTSVARGVITTDGWINELSVLLGVRLLIERPLQYFRRHGANTTDHILHRPQAVGVLDLVRQRASRAPAEDWLRQVRVLEFYEEWLAANRSRLQSAGIERVDGAMIALAIEKHSHAARAALVLMPLSRRLPRIWSLWRRGGYRYFHGWMSALRDLIRSA